MELQVRIHRVRISALLSPLPAGMLALVWRSTHCDSTDICIVHGVPRAPIKRQNLQVYRHALRNCAPYVTCNPDNTLEPSELCSSQLLIVPEMVRLIVLNSSIILISISSMRASGLFL